MGRLILVTVAMILGLVGWIPGTRAQEATPAPAVGEAVDPALCRVAPRTADEVLRIWTAQTGTPSAGMTNGTILDATLSAAPAPLGTPADAETVAAITALVREAIACQNAEDLGRYFALISDALLGRALAASGEATRANVDEVLAPSAPDAPADQTRLIAITDVSVMADGRIGAFVIAFDPTATPAVPETRLFLFKQERGHWVIDGGLSFTANTEDNGEKASGAPATPAADLPGVSGNSYLSPNFGFALTWDAGWTVAAATSTGHIDIVRLNHGHVSASFQGVEAGAGSTMPADPAACLAATVSQLAKDSRFVHFAPAPASVAAPIGNGPGGAAAVYTADVTASSGAVVPTVVFVSCRSLGPDAVLFTTYVVVATGVEEAIPLFRALDANLVLPDTATPAAA